MINKIYAKLKNFILNNFKFLIGILVIVFLFTYELPFVVYTPGGIVPLEKRIKIENTSSTIGSFNMSYVSLRKGTIPVVLLSFIIPNWDLLKESDITSNEDSVDDLLKKEKLYMQSSLDNATILAYQKSGSKLTITENINTITYIDEKADTDLKLYDEILKADNQKIENIEELRTIINSKKDQETIKITVLRNGKEKECVAKIYQEKDSLRIGIAFLTTYKYTTDPKITIKTKNSESGSSGGLMLTLAIYNELTESDLTHGQKIVGTGTIDINGNVGAIDGVKYKMLGASKNKADIFICPLENYEEVVKIKEKYNLKMEVKGVSTFDEALEFLENI